MPRYLSARAFEQALKHRLSSGKAGVAGGQRLVCLERFLARVAALQPETVLKGGLALKLRLPSARATKDIDLRVAGDAAGMLSVLQEAGRSDLGDFLEYRVRFERELPGSAQSISRFHADCLLGGKRFADPFHIDVSFGEPVVAAPEVVAGADWLAFAGIPPLRAKVHALEAHIAEKLHAYTLPRTTQNTRVKDLPNLALLACIRSVDAAALGCAIEATFRHRRTHDLVRRVPRPDQSWDRPYRALVEDNDLRWASLDGVTDAVCAFLDPVLAGARGQRWHPADWVWREA